MAADRVTLVLTPTGSLAGVVQIAARVVEVALHKAHEIGFPLDAILEGAGSTPLPPPTRDALAAMGRTNDTILFGGQVQLVVSCADEDARDLAERLPSSASRDYGKPFAEVFRDYGYDFFQVDPMLFSPAQVAVTALEKRPHLSCRAPGRRAAGAFLRRQCLRPRAPGNSPTPSPMRYGEPASRSWKPPSPAT